MARTPARTRTLLALAAFFLVVIAAPSQAAAKPTTYENPLRIQVPGDGLVESCADPSVIHSRTPGDDSWYAYCTTDPLNDDDRNADGSFRFRLIPILRSIDLVRWTYVGDAFASRPAWVRDDAGLWAPDIAYVDGKYHLYYTAPDTDLPGGGSAIGVGVSSSPSGPFTDSGGPVVEPSARWTFDPDFVEVGDVKYLFYGSYFGGISARQLTTDGLRSIPATQTQIAIPNRYEGAHVVKRDGFFYLFGSATDCCRGPLTGYSVFVGRSQHVLGPYADKDGQSLLQGRVGGTPVLSMNGNRWVGPGHNTVFTDEAGQWWTLYHAVDRTDPYFDGAVGFTKRPLLLDPITWVDGWPDVRGGLWASNTPQPGPVTEPGEKSGHEPPLARDARVGQPVPELSDEFDSATLAPRWTWVREPAPATYGLTGSAFRFDTQAADLFVDSNSASVLLERAPKHDYVVETRIRLNLPPEGCCFNYVQAGLVLYGGDDNFLKLAHVSIWETRQTEWAKELAPVPAGYPRYGNTVVGAPGEWTTLRVVGCRGTGGREDTYRAHTRRDGGIWVRGGVWTHSLADERIGLVSMGGSGFIAEFDYVRVYRAHGCSQAIKNG
ncbi:MAG: family 43 glycosylhydrolase [Gaiellaceae bacterium MAG52_C11]|nr:family 43 glycosylhydrolase [Candidatus Gaiellasilicea maunaloa]